MQLQGHIARTMAANRSVYSTTIPTHYSLSPSPTPESFVVVPHLTHVSTGNTIALVVLVTIVFIVGVIGNALVIYVFGWKCRHSRNNSQCLLFLLGVFDFVFASIMPLVIIVRLLGSYEVSYNAGCKVMPIALIVSVTTSQVILICICYDRYNAILHPFRPRHRNCFMKRAIAASFLLSIAFSVPVIFDIHNQGYTDAFYCFETFNKSPSFVAQSLLLISRDFVTFCIMVFFIRKMLIRLEKMQRSRKTSCTSEVLREARYERTRLLLSAIVTAFKICIVPYDLYLFFLVTFKFGDRPRHSSWVNIVTLGSYLILFQISSSAANVFLYSSYHPDFTFIRRMLKCCRRQ